MVQFYEGTEIGDEMEILFKASQIPCTEIEETKDWHFTGSFDGFITPGKLQQFLKWVISDSYTNVNVFRERETSKHHQEIWLNTSSHHLNQGDKLHIRQKQKANFENQRTRH